MTHYKWYDYKHAHTTYTKQLTNNTKQRDKTKRNRKRNRHEQKRERERGGVGVGRCGVLRGAGFFSGGQLSTAVFWFMSTGNRWFDGYKDLADLSE